MAGSGGRSIPDAYHENTCADWRLTATGIFSAALTSSFSQGARKIPHLFKINLFRAGAWVFGYLARAVLLDTSTLASGTMRLCKNCHESQCD